MEGFRKKLSFLLLFNSLLLLGCGFLLFYFIKNINFKVKDINNYQQALFEKSKLLDKIQSLDKEARQAEGYFPLLYQSLPTESEIINLESKLKNLASIYNLNTFSFRFGTLQANQNNEPKNYSFNLLLEGKASDLLNWFAAFLRLPYALRLEQIEMTQSNSSNNRSLPLYKIQILGRIYLR